MNILITGANGQLGKCIQDRIAKITNANNYYVFSDLMFDNIKLEETTKYYLLDLTDEKDVENFILKNCIDVVVNCAAYTNVDGAETDYETAEAVNAIVPQTLARICKKHSITLIHISTDYVFNGTKKSPYKEDDKTDSLNVYGKTKRMGEEFIVESGCKYIVLRTAWLYSKYGRNFLDTISNRVISGKDTYVIDDQIGTPTYAGDLADFIISLIESNHNFDADKPLDRCGIYHFTNEGVCTWYDFAKTIEKFCSNVNNSRTVIKPTSTEDYFKGRAHAIRPHCSVLDKRKIKEVFPEFYVPTYWKDSLWRCIREKH